MTMEARTEALIADDEGVFLEAIAKAIREVLPDLNVQAFADPMAIQRKLREVSDKVFLVISDGDMGMPSDGEDVTFAALKAEVPHVAYYSSIARVKARELEPNGIKCIQKLMRDDDTTALREWLQSIKNPQE